MDKNLDDLYKIYRSNIKKENDVPPVSNEGLIGVGDIIVASYNGNEIRGEVSAVYEGHYYLKGRSGNIRFTIDDITEHYPKNKNFNKKIIKESAEKRIDPDATKPLMKKKKIIKEYEEEDQMKNHPDDQVDMTVENNSMDHIKAIGKVIYYSTVKYSDVNDMFEKKLLSREKYWYLLTEKQNEIHVIRNNDKGFEIQPFVTTLIGHFLKQNNKLNESYNQIKVKGNNSFSIISNIPPNVQKQLVNNLVGLLSGLKDK